MRTIYRKIFLPLTLLLVLGAVASASASASQWYVGGKALTGATALSGSVKVEESIVFSLPQDKVKITCPSVTERKAKTEEPLEILAPSTAKLGELVFVGCHLTEDPGKCYLNNGEEETLPMGPFEAKLTLGTSSEDSLELVSLNGQSVWTIMEAECYNGPFYAGYYFVKGTAKLRVPTGQKESVEQELVGEGEASKNLKGFEVPMYITGKIKLKLASGQAWSFH